MLYLHAVDQLDALMRSGATLDDAESFIDPLCLSEDQKSALWLFAFSAAPDRVRETLALVAG